MLPSFGLHPLDGDRIGHNTIILSRNWHLTFAWSDENAIDADLEDHHGHQDPAPSVDRVDASERNASENMTPDRSRNRVSFANLPGMSCTVLYEMPTAGHAEARQAARKWLRPLDPHVCGAFRASIRFQLSSERLFDV